MDQRLKELEIQLRSLVSGQQQILDKLSELPYKRNSQTIRDHEDDANGGRHCRPTRIRKGPIRVDCSHPTIQACTWNGSVRRPINLCSYWHNLLEDYMKVCYMK
ncbi:hypothetical protein ACE6H2_011803 [Prunus campanulata]